MRICFYPGSAELREQIDAAEIQYEKWRPSPGTIYASSGDMILIAGDAAPWAALAAICVQWLRAYSTRQVTIVTGENQLIHARGYSVEELTHILKDAKMMDAIDPSAIKKPPVND